MTDQDIIDMEEAIEGMEVDSRISLKHAKILEDGIPRMLKELKRHREVLKYVFERAKLARLHMHNGRNDAYEYLVQIREKEEALKKGDEILKGEKG